MFDLLPSMTIDNNRNKGYVLYLYITISLESLEIKTNSWIFYLLFS